MMAFRARVLFAALLPALLLACPPGLGAQQVPYWPSDQERRLAQVESQVVEKMDEIATARLRDDNEKAESLTKEFKTLQDERVQLLRATGKLPR